MNPVLQTLSKEELLALIGRSPFNRFPVSEILAVRQDSARKRASGLVAKEQQAFDAYMKAFRERDAATDPRRLAKLQIAILDAEEVWEKAKRAARAADATASRLWDELQKAWEVERS